IILLCRQMVQPVSELGGDELAGTSASQVLPPRNEVVLGPAFRHPGEITFSHVDLGQFNTSAPTNRSQTLITGTFSGSFAYLIAPSSPGGPYRTATGQIKGTPAPPGEQQGLP